jgi:DNA invertase Pin-like site-specific DNA recombinase
MILFWSLDRFSRAGVLETLKLLRELDDLGVCWRSHSEPYLDSCGAFKDAILAILAAIAKQERLRISERVKAGLDIAAAKGRYPGRPPTEKHDPVKMAEVFRLRKHGRSIRGIARDIGISKTTVQRLVRDAAGVTQ